LSSNDLQWSASNRPRSNSSRESSSDILPDSSSATVCSSSSNASSKESILISSAIGLIVDEIIAPYHNAYKKGGGRNSTATSFRKVSRSSCGINSCRPAPDPAAGPRASNG